MLSGAFPEYQLNKNTLEVYYLNLSDFDPKDFEKVILAHIRENKWFPKISELRQELVRLRGFSRATPSDVWDSLIKAAESDQEPEMDANTERALRVCGGWEGFCRMTYRDLQFTRKDFERVFNEGLEREDNLIRLGQAPVPEMKRVAHEEG